MPKLLTREEEQALELLTREEKRLLTREEEIALARKIRGKGRDGESLEARNELIERNFGLAGLMVGKTRFLNLNPKEALSVAYLTLVYTAERFDPDRGVRFSSYACSSIKKNLINYASQKKREFTLDTEDQDLLPNIAVDYRENNHKLDKDMIKILYEAIKTLSPREQRIIFLRYHAGYTLEKVGDEFELTKERIRQIQEKAVRKIRKNLRNRGLEAEVVLS